MARLRDAANASSTFPCCSCRPASSRAFVAVSSLTLAPPTPARPARRPRRPAERTPPEDRTLASVSRHCSSGPSSARAPRQSRRRGLRAAARARARGAVSRRLRGGHRTRTAGRRRPSRREARARPVGSGRGADERAGVVVELVVIGASGLGRHSSAGTRGWGRRFREAARARRARRARVWTGTRARGVARRRVPAPGCGVAEGGSEEGSRSKRHAARRRTEASRDAPGMSRERARWRVGRRACEGAALRTGRCRPTSRRVRRP